MVFCFRPPDDHLFAHCCCCGCHDGRLVLRRRNREAGRLFLIVDEVTFARGALCAEGLTSMFSVVKVVVA